jgi:hypothetical protein
VYFPQATMLRLPAIAVSLVALALPADATSGRVVAFDRASAQPNERVNVTSALNVPLRLYLVRDDVAAQVTSRTDRRLTFIGVVRAKRSLTFSMPPLGARTYRLTRRPWTSPHRAAGVCGRASPTSASSTSCA